VGGQDVAGQADGRLEAVGGRPARSERVRASTALAQTVGVDLEWMPSSATIST
jgi:hypothetical protein